MMKVVLIVLALVLCNDWSTEEVMAKELNHEQEDRACSLDDGGKKAITIEPAPQGTIPQLWTSSGTCSFSYQRFESSIAIPAAEILLLRRISATYCGNFSSEALTAIDADCPASYPTTDATNSFGGAMPIPLLRLGSVDNGMTGTLGCVRSYSLPPADRLPLYASFTVFSTSCCRRLVEPSHEPFVLPGKFRFENGVGVRGMGVVYVYRGCGNFSTETLTAIDADCPASNPTTDGTSGFGGAMPIPLLRLGTVNNGATGSLGCVRSYSLPIADCKPSMIGVI